MKRNVIYRLRFRDPVSGKLIDSWTDVDGTTLKGGDFDRRVDAMKAAKPFVNWNVERIAA